MTIHGYGKVVPSQLDMLNLGGDIRLFRGTVPPTDHNRIARMKHAHEMLKMITGRDFGYDLAAWHHFLLNHAKLSKEYKYQAIWKTIRLRIEELLEDPDRLRLVRLLEEEYSDADASGG